MSQVDLKSYEAQLVKARDSIITNTGTGGYVIFGYAGLKTWLYVLTKRSF